MKLDSRMFILGAAVGIVLMLASFIAYVVEPETTYTTIFAIGAILLIGGYVLGYMENRKYRSDYWEAVEQQEKEGVFFLALDDDYVPYDNPATIEDLRDM